MTAFDPLRTVFSFVSGQIAKTDPDAMVLATPLATIGIRGTTGVLSLPAGGDVTVVLVPNADGTTGEIIVQPLVGGLPAGPPAILSASLEAITVAAGGQMGQIFTIPTAQFEQQFGQIIQDAQSSAASVGNTGGLEVVRVGEGGVSTDDILVHDQTNHALASLLAPLQPPAFPVVFGVIYNNPGAPYDAQVRMQIADAKARAKGPKPSIEALLKSGYTWEVA